MTEPRPSLLADLRREIGSLGDEVKEMAALRLELAQMEWQSAVGEVKRLVLGTVVASVLGLTALPIAAVAAADLLEGTLGISREGWLLIEAGALLTAAVAGGFLAWRRFQRRFAGFEETLEELREDLDWIKNYKQSD